MKLSSLGDRDRRALMIAGIVLIPSLLFVFGVKPYVAALADVREQTEQERDFLKREQALARRLPALPEEKAAASRQLRQEAARLFTGEDDLAATGNLSEYVASVADRNGVQLQQSETRNSLPVAQGVRALQIEVRADGDVYGILHFLQQLEAGDKLIRVGRLSIERGRRNPLDTAGGKAQEILTLAASVYGYRLDGVPYNARDSVLSGAPSPFSRASIDLPSVDAVIDRNPFDPLRQAPNTTRYAAGGGGAESEEPALRLVGTVVVPGGNGSFAVCNIGRPTSQIVRLGEQINGFTLRSVMPKRAIFTTPTGGQLTLETPVPGKYATSSGQGGRGGRGGRGNNRSAPNEERTAEAAKQIAAAEAAAVRQQMLEQAAREGGEVQVIELPEGGGEVQVIQMPGTMQTTEVQPVPSQGNRRRNRQNGQQQQRQQSN